MKSKKNISEKTLATYSHRNSLLHNNRTYKIRNDKLVWQDDDIPEVSLEYSNIKTVEAQFAPTRVQSNRYLLRLTTKSKGKVDITNTTYKGIGHFEELNQTYVPFVRELNRRIAEKNPKIQFKKGSSWAGYVFSIFIGILLFVVIIAAFLFFLNAGVLWLAAIKLIILIFFFPRLLRYIKRNKPASYDPLNLPANILPN